MTAIPIWVSRDENGIVDAAIVAEYSDAKTLRKWRAAGRTPELVLAADVSVGAKLPSGAEIVTAINFANR